MDIPMVIVPYSIGLKISIDQLGKCGGVSFIIQYQMPSLFLTPESLEHFCKTF